MGTQRRRTWRDAGNRWAMIIALGGMLAIPCAASAAPPAQPDPDCVGVVPGVGAGTGVALMFLQPLASTGRSVTRKNAIWAGVRAGPA